MLCMHAKCYPYSQTSGFLPHMFSACKENLTVLLDPFGTSQATHHFLKTQASLGDSQIKPELAIRVLQAVSAQWCIQAIPNTNKPLPSDCAHCTVTTVMEIS